MVYAAGRIGRRSIMRACRTVEEAEVIAADMTVAGYRNVMVGNSGNAAQAEAVSRRDRK